jgi:hypothetical protein
MKKEEDLYKKIMEAANIIATKQRTSSGNFVITTEKRIQLRKIKIMNLFVILKKNVKIEFYWR